MARNSGEMSSLSFEDDPRPECKYGAKCYQKNQVHLKSYKHPTNLKRDHQADNRGEAKKQKRDLQDSGASSDEENPKRNDSKNSDQEENGKRKEQISDSSDSEMSVEGAEPAKKKMVPHSEIQDRSKWNKIMKEKFLVEMPGDFYEFWNFCISISNMHPADVFKQLGLVLVGPYDVLAGKLNGELLAGRDLLTHWRYFYDPPEFQTVLKGDDKTLYHIGYFRDDPKDDPCFLASNAAAKGCTLTPMADNIFSAVNAYLTTSMKTVTPFLKMKYVNMQKLLQKWASNSGFSLSTLTPAMKNRQKNIVTKSFHGAGIVVPVNERTQIGYRELLESDVRIKKILKLIVDSESEKEIVRDLCFSKLDPIITAANIANDECDFGTSLELGIDLFCFGGKTLEAPALALLTTAYSLLRRPEFSQIIKAHMANRKEGFELSAI